MRKMSPLSNETILQAASGNPEAIKDVLDRYAPYINTVAGRWVTRPDGRIRYAVDYDRKCYIESKLMTSILKWKVIIK